MLPGCWHDRQKWRLDVGSFPPPPYSLPQWLLLVGRSVILTCESQRTMRTCINPEMMLRPSALQPAAFDSCTHCFLSAYCSYSPGLLQHAAQQAQQASLAAGIMHERTPPLFFQGFVFACGQMLALVPQLMGEMHNTPSACSRQSAVKSPVICSTQLYL